MVQKKTDRRVSRTVDILHQTRCVQCAQMPGDQEKLPDHRLGGLDLLEALPSVSVFLKRRMMASSSPPNGRDPSGY